MIVFLQLLFSRASLAVRDFNIVYWRVILKSTIKIISLIIAAVITVLVCSKTVKKQGEQRIVLMDECTYPVVYMLSDDLRYNRLYGYASERDYNLLLEGITVIPENRRLKIDIDRYNSDISGVGYEIRSLDGANLYEDSEAIDVVDLGSHVTATLPIKNLLEHGEDYLLVIKLKTSKKESIYYYTRIRYDENAKISYKTSLVREFSDTTLDKTKVRTLNKYMETSDAMDNTDLGYVNIHSDIDMLGYKFFTVNRIDEPAVTVVEVSGTKAVIRLDYKLLAELDGESSIFDVSETFTMDESPRGMYLMGYDRYVTEEYKYMNSVKSTSRIYLGISDVKDVDYKYDKQEYYIAYVVNGELYMYDHHENELNRIFTYDISEGDSVRERHNEHDMKVLDVSEDGNIRFIIYGYMNNSLHEGEVGISVMDYDHEKKSCSEIMFIPYACTYATLEEQLSDIFYADEAGNITVLYQDKLVNIDHETGEYTEVIDHIDDYCVSADKAYMAYTKGDSISVLDIKKKTAKNIEVPEGSLVRIIGYIENDLIYGIGDKADIYNDITRSQIAPLNRLYVLDKELNVIKEYAPSDAYITGGEIIGNRARLTRVKKTDAGFVSIDDDQLLNKNDNSVAVNDAVSTVSSARRLRERILKLSSPVYDARDVSYGYTKHIYFDKGVIDSAWHLSGDTRIYDIRKARMEYLCKPNCKALADEAKAYVYNIADCKDYSSYELSDVLGFVAMGGFVVSRDKNDNEILICGYTKDELTCRNSSGELIKLKYSDIRDDILLVCP